MGWNWACDFKSAFGIGLFGLCFSWAHEICEEDNDERALVTAIMNEMAHLLLAWLPLVMWQQVEVPQYHRVSFLSGPVIVTALVVRFLQNRELEHQ
jgi:ACS family pantothenate transporter-like MFS transporter